VNSAVFSAAAMVAILLRTLRRMAALSARAGKPHCVKSGIFCRLFAGYHDGNGHYSAWRENGIRTPPRSDGLPGRECKDCAWCSVRS